MQYDLTEDQINSLRQMDALKKAAKAIAEAAKLMKMTNAQDLTILLVNLSTGYINGRPI